MAGNYDNKTNYNSGDFKRNVSQESGAANGPGVNVVKLSEKANEYLKELLSEKVNLNIGNYPIVSKLVDEEVNKIQSMGRTPTKYLDVYKNKLTTVTVKVLIPHREHPKFNFVGNLLGPKGNTMKQLQEETMCKIAILGRGSMRDRQKEEELRVSLDPKYAHLTDELHVEITSKGPPAEAHARIAYAVAEVKKYLIPDPGPDMWQPPMDRGGHRIGPPGRPPRLTRPPPPAVRGPPKGKVVSIFHRARSDNEYTYDDDYSGPPEPQMRPPRAPKQEFYYERSSERYYEDDLYNEDEPMPEYKTSSARDVGTRRTQPGAAPRHQPYQRPQNQMGRGPHLTNKPSSGHSGWK